MTYFFRDYVVIVKLLSPTATKDLGPFFYRRQSKDCQISASPQRILDPFSFFNFPLVREVSKGRFATFSLK